MTTFPLEKTIEKFKAHFVQGDPDECWIWQGPYNRMVDGRPDARFRGMVIGRLVWTLYHGIPRFGCIVAHECDRPLCTNPRHLRLDTQKGNMIECWAKGRHPGNRKNTPNKNFPRETIMAIYADPRSCKEIAADYAVSSNSIWNIKTGRRYTALFHPRLVVNMPGYGAKVTYVEKPAGAPRRAPEAPASPDRPAP